ncbi:hypothetical protein [Robbsia andropogonis]|uniref:hypothetical protein n=1 Tax=Robbsia andropogonis TaxID=28092 RepID=UPI000466F6FC|nr:hypothetical protein [Robbsia andropogonis]
MSFIAAFFVGAFLCNAIPHVSAGLRGEAFPSPFSKPRGKGPSSPLVNFLWGFLNALVGLVLIFYHPLRPGANIDSAALLAGVLAMGVITSVHFGRVRRAGLF